TPSVHRKPRGTWELWRSLDCRIQRMALRGGHDGFDKSVRHRFNVLLLFDGFERAQRHCDFVRSWEPHEIANHSRDSLFRQEFVNEVSIAMVGDEVSFGTVREAAGYRNSIRHQLLNRQAAASRQYSQMRIQEEACFCIAIVKSSVKHDSVADPERLA